MDSRRDETRLVPVGDAHAMLTNTELDVVVTARSTGPRR